MNLDKYKSVKYHDNDYNCLHFAVDFYRDLTGCDMGLYVTELLTGRDKRTINPSKLKEFKQISAPIDPCLAIMRGGEVHAGIYTDGLIIHLTNTGINAQPPHIARLRHGAITYYQVN